MKAFFGKLHTVYTDINANTQLWPSNKTDAHIYPLDLFPPWHIHLLLSFPPLNSRDGGNDYTLFSIFLCSSPPCGCRELFIQSTSHSTVYSWVLSHTLTSFQLYRVPICQVVWNAKILSHKRKPLQVKNTQLNDRTSISPLVYSTLTSVSLSASLNWKGNDYFPFSGFPFSSETIRPVNLTLGSISVGPE